MDWRKVYIKIISNAKNENRKKYDGIYYESHHILPKSLFPNWKDRDSNQVLLTAREHLFCHLLLVKIYPKSHEMRSALWFMSSKSKSNKCNYPKLSLREYERIKIAYAKSNSEHLKGKKNPNMARSFSEETLKLIGEKNKGNTNTKGKTWWTNGTESKMAFEAPGDDWIKGRNTKGRPAWNKGIPMTSDAKESLSKTLKEKNSLLNEEERKRKFGNRKGKAPWNKKQ